MKYTSFLLVMLLTGCQTSSESSIGVLAPFSGPVASCGTEFEIGLEVAKQVVNSDVKLIYEDTAFNPQQALNAAHKLIYEDEVQIIIGACSSSSTLAVAPLTEEAEVLLFTPASFADSISYAGDYVFRAILSPSQDAAKIAEFIENDLQEERVAVFYLNNDYGVSYLDGFTEEFAGEVISETGSFEDVENILLKMEEEGIDTVFVPHLPNAALSLLREAEELGMEVTMVATAAMEKEEFIADDLSEGVFISSLVDPENVDNLFLSTKDKLYPTYEVTTSRLLSYDILLLIMQAQEECGEDTSCVKDFLYSVEDYEGASGVFSIDANGDAIHEASYITVIRNHTFVRVK